MNDTQPLEPSMIGSYLERNNIRYMRDDGGGFFAFFGPSGPADTEMQVSLRAEGDIGDIYAIRVTTSTYYSTEEWPQLLALVNRWNCERRFPKVYLSFRADAAIASLVAESQVDLERGTCQDFVDHFTYTGIAVGFHFFQWLREVRPSNPAPAPSDDDLESWLREAS